MFNDRCLDSSLAMMASASLCLSRPWFHGMRQPCCSSIGVCRGKTVLHLRKNRQLGEKWETISDSMMFKAGLMRRGLELQEIDIAVDEDHDWNLAIPPLTGEVPKEWADG